MNLTPFFFLLGICVGCLAPLLFFLYTNPVAMMERTQRAEEDLKKIRELERLTKLIKDQFKAICTVECPHCKNDIDCTKF